MGLENLLEKQAIEQHAFTLVANLVDVHNKQIFVAQVTVDQLGIISKIECMDGQKSNTLPYLMPGFVDAHVHIESSMLMPSEFARVAVRFGVLGAVCDPHEIANVLGSQGVYAFIENGKASGFNFFFGAPSCVPATPIDRSGAIIDAHEIAEMLKRTDIHFLGEMMNYPGVINGDLDVRAKIKAAHDAGKPIDGHAPDVRASDLQAYVAAGISTDHECKNMEEALEKLDLGMHVLIREGSAARNFESLHKLISSHTSQIMLCTDDTHPNDLQKGYINALIQKGLQYGHSLYDLLQVACLNPIAHYKLDIGQLRVGDRADFILTDTIDTNFRVQASYIKGKLAYQNGAVYLNRPAIDATRLNNFVAQPIKVENLTVPLQPGKLNVIQVLDNDLYTQHIQLKPSILGNNVVADISKDLLKMVVINRYLPNQTAVVGFVKGFGLTSGAICSCIAHDSHNIIAVGVSDADLVQAINAVINQKGGLALSNNQLVQSLALPVGGIVSDQNIEYTAKAYEDLHHAAMNLGSTVSTPFMTLAFMSLIVIPELKICDTGLFNVASFCMNNLFTVE